MTRGKKMTTKVETCITHCLLQQQGYLLGPRPNGTYGDNGDMSPLSFGSIPIVQGGKKMFATLVILSGTNLLET